MLPARGGGTLKLFKVRAKVISASQVQVLERGATMRMRERPSTACRPRAADACAFAGRAAVIVFRRGCSGSAGRCVTMGSSESGRDVKTMLLRQRLEVGLLGSVASGWIGA